MQKFEAFDGPQTGSGPQESETLNGLQADSDLKGFEIFSGPPLGVGAAKFRDFKFKRRRNSTE